MLYAAVTATHNLLHLCYSNNCISAGEAGACNKAFWLILTASDQQDIFICSTLSKLTQIQKCVHVDVHYKADEERRKVIASFLLSLLLLGALKTALCFLVSNTVSIVFKKQNKSASSIYTKNTIGFILFTLEMWWSKNSVLFQYMAY